MMPDTIRVGYVDVEVHVEDLSDDCCFGYFEAYPYPKIVLHSNLRPIYVAATAFHETLEAISAIYGLELTEGQIRTLETAIVDLILRNPGHAKKWMEMLNDEKDKNQERVEDAYADASPSRSASGDG